MSDRPAFDPKDAEDMALSNALPALSEEVTALYAKGAVDTVVIFFSTVPGREFAKVLPKSEAVEAGKRMSESMAAQIDAAPRLPVVRVFHTRSNGAIDERDLPLLAAYMDPTQQPS